MKKKPYISILIPCFNEGNYIRLCLESLVDDFVIANAEVLIMDGGSTDGTREIIKRYIKDHSNAAINLLDNPKRHQSYGLNIGIDQARGEIIVRVDVHAKYPERYIERCVNLLKCSGADNVGGVIDPRGKGNRFQELMALALINPLGVGDAKFHLGNYSGYVDTVYLGTFWKNTFKKLGYFDPYNNQDAEFNLRILRSGGKIYLDKSIKVGYFPRDSLKGLIKQYFNYGKGRCRTTLKHKRFTAFRQVIPILLVISLFGAFVLSLVLNPVFLLFPLLYVLSIIFGSSLALKRERVWRLGDMLTLSVIFMSIHIPWGVGFLTRLLGMGQPETQINYVKES